MTQTGVQLGIYGYGPFGRLPEEDLDAVLSVCADTGYAGAEIMTNLMPRGAAGVRRAFASEGLECTGLHVFYGDVEDEAGLARALEFATGVGCPRLICSGTRGPSLEDYRASCARLHEVAEAGRAAGIALYYHNHDGEFVTVDGERRGIDLLIDSTDPDLVRFNVDVYWAHVGTGDPASVVEELAHRSGYYHFKDGRGSDVRELGLGEVDLAACLDAARSAPIDWVVVEQDRPTASPEESCKRNRQYLRSLGI